MGSKICIKTTFLVVFTCLLLASCTKDKESNLALLEQEEMKAKILNSDEFKLIQAQLEQFNEDEAASLKSIEFDQTSNQIIQENDEPFIFFVIGDTELNMRENTYEQLQNWINHVNTVDDFNLEFVSGDFEEGESKKISKPELVFLAGDINKDRAFGFDFPGGINFETKQLTNQLVRELDDDILFFPGNGNHDWDPTQFGDGSYGHNLGGLFSNNGTAQFVRNHYHRAINSTELDQNASFNYDKNITWFPAISTAEFNYSLIYKGIRFTQLNQFLQTPVAMVSFESLIGTGPAVYHPNRTSNWFKNICEASGEDSIPHVVVQHFPVFTEDNWWNDKLGTSSNELRKEFLDLFSTAYQPSMFTGHLHFNRTTNVLPYEINDYTAGYFADGHVIAVKASASKGAYAIAYVNFNSMTVRDPALFSTSFTVAP